MGLNKTSWIIVTLALAIVALIGLKMAYNDSSLKAPDPATPAALPTKPPQPIVLQVDDKIAQPLTQRIGLNLSFWTPWGASQYMHNVLMNPGFEAGEVDRILVIVQQADNNSFSDSSGLGMADDYWSGATFDVRSGQSAGTKGTLKRSLHSGAGDLPKYFADGLPALAVNDVIVLTKSSAAAVPPQWSAPNPSLIKLSPDHRPESTGNWSVALSPAKDGPAEVNTTLDGITDRAGILLPINQPWQISFWTKAEGDRPALVVSFGREGSKPLLHEIVTPSSEWHEVILPIPADKNNQPASLKLSLIAALPDTTVYIDDIKLGPIQNSETAWSQDTIDMVKRFRPSWLRDWQGQIGDTFQNRIADPFSRISYAYRTQGGPGSQYYGYSIPEFLDLCSEVQANPWLIVPTTLSDEELAAFGQFLTQHCDQTRFSEVILEFSNEPWNRIFRSMGISSYASHGAVADRAFQLITSATSPHVNLRKMIKGQYGNPEVTKQFLASAANYDSMAIAPYFFTTMNEGSANLQALFATDNGLLEQNASYAAQAGKTFAIAEVNLSTMRGTATPSEREPLVAGAASGSALASRLIQGMALNASPQMVFSLSQFDAPAWDITGMVRLWGITRDISATRRLRPTGLAVQMLNQVAGGSLHAIQPMASDERANRLTTAAFRNANAWSAAIVSAHPTPTEITLTFPSDERTLPAFANVLSASSPTATNEEGQNVSIAKEAIRTDGRAITVTVPAYGFVVLTRDEEMPKY
ncbi:MAG: hypothetical protein LLG04_05845 [Parachlamydia sp.]|nr:hypothetical protein [Parachlamydia sp.]